MKATNKLRKRRAISPVIATVILVAVAITVAVAVSYWMGSLAGQYTSFEKVEIQSGYAKINPGEGWTIPLTLKNTGSETATLIGVFVNDVPVTGGTGGHDAYASFDAFNLGDAGLLIIGTNLKYTGGTPAEVHDIIESGASSTLEVYIGLNYGTLSPGTTVNIKIHSAGGMDYIKLIKLV